MRRLLLSQILVLLSFAAAVTVEAGPITGQPIVPVAGEVSGGGETASDDEESGGGGEISAFDTSVLFDSMGLPLLRLSAPIYLRLGVSSPVESAPEGGSDLGNVGWTPAPIPIPPPPGAVPEPAALLLCLPGAFFALRRLARKSPQRA